MKKNLKKRIIGLSLTLVITLTSMLSLSSCGYLQTGVVDAKINEFGELVLYYDNGAEQNLGEISSNSTSLKVENYGGDVSAATTKGLVSAVSITANFERTVNNSYGGLFPGLGGNGGSTTSKYSSGGSGVIYKLDRDSGSAFIITNYHVVYDSSCNTEDGISDDIDIYLYGREYESLAIPATYVGGSLYYDIAVLYVENCEELQSSIYNSVDMAQAEEVAVGATAIAIGNPEGYGISASLGIVSVDSEYITMTAADDTTSVTFRVMRVDTAVNSGNSGGGLYNENGELIGIVNAKIVKSTVENIAYAIPVAVASAVADNIIDNCFEKNNSTVMRAMLGVTLGVTDSHAVMDEEKGVLKIEETVKITEISSGSVADGLLQVGDAIKSVTVDGVTREVTRRHHLIDTLLCARAGDTVKITVEREGKEVSVDIFISDECIISY